MSDKPSAADSTTTGNVRPLPRAAAASRPMSGDEDMDLQAALGLDERGADMAWAVAHAAIHAGGAPGPRGAALLAVLGEALGRRPRSAAPPDPESVARALPTEAARATLLHGLILAAGIEGEISAGAATYIADLGRALGVRSHWVALLPALQARRTFAVKRALVRHSPDAKQILARTWAEDGLVGMFRAVRFAMGRFVDPPLAARFRALESSPAGSFGRAFFDHIASRGLEFPGEPKGMPEKMIHHDLMHVVNGYDTDAAGECEIAGFYAASASGDAFTYLLTALATFHIGLPVSPAVVETKRGALDPGRVIRAFVRGRRLRVDVMGRWDYWALFPLGLPEVRAHLGIAPRSSDSTSP